MALTLARSVTADVFMKSSCSYPASSKYFTTLPGVGTRVLELTSTGMEKCEKVKVSHSIKYQEVLSKGRVQVHLGFRQDHKGHLLARRLLRNPYKI